MNCIGITSVYVPGSLKALKNSEFSGCTGITRVEIGEGLESVTNFVWNQAVGIRDFYLPESLTNFDRYSYNNYQKPPAEIVIPTVHCYRGSYAETWAARLSANIEYRYKVVDSGSCNDAISWILYEDGTLEITGTGELCSGLWNPDAVINVVLSGGITAVGDGVFDNCVNLTSVTLDDSLTSIGSEAFRNCQNLQSVTNTEQVSHIGDRAFYGCVNLSEFTVGDSVAIGQDAFMNCDLLFEPYGPESERKGEIAHVYQFASFTEADTGAELTPEQAMQKYALESNLYEYADGSMDAYISSGSGSVYLTNLQIYAPQTHVGSDGTEYITGDYEYQVPGGSIRLRQASSGYSMEFEPYGTLMMLEQQETESPMVGLVSSWKLDRIEAGGTVQYRQDISSNPIDELYLYENGYAKAIDTSGTAAYLSYVFSDTGFTVGSAVFQSVPDGEYVLANADGSVSYYIGMNRAYSKEHEHQASIKPAVAPTCEKTGLTEGSYCSICGKDIDEQESVPALGHSWETPEYTWSADHGSVTAVRICARDSSHKEEETVAATSVVFTEATCTGKGETLYTSEAFSNPAFDIQQLMLEDIPAAGHEWGEAAYQWSEDNSEVTATRVCLKDSSHSESETVSTTSYRTDPSCDEEGATVYVASAFHNAGFTVQRRTVADKPALGHVWGEPVYTWNEDYSELTGQRNCLRNPGHIESETVSVTVQEIKPVTCEEDGEILYVSDDFVNEAFSVQQVPGYTPYMGHAWLEPEYTWAPDHSSVTAERFCQNDPTHFENETVQLSAALLTRWPTEENDGQIIYISESYTNPFFGAQNLEVTVPSLGQIRYLKLPNLLERIEEEAFVNTSSEFVRIPDGCTEIGARAFADSPSLKYVAIPSSVTAIMDDCFQNDAYLTLLVENGSYAQQYAIENQITYAVFSDGVIPERYTIVFSDNGGTGAPGDQTKYAGIDLQLSSVIPQKDCFVTLDYGNGTESDERSIPATFLGWNTEYDGSGQNYPAGSYYKDDQAVTLFAQWQNSVLGDLPVPARDGYYFDGWYTEQNGGNQVNSAFEVDQNMTIYAHWHSTVSYTISYSANGGEGAPDSQEKYDQTDLILSSGIPVNAYSVTIHPENGSPEETRTGYASFLGWNTKQDGTGTLYQPGAVYADDASAVLYAQWEPVLVGTLPQVEREGYIFTGWFTEKKDGTKVTEETDVQGDLSVYAQWEKSFITISYDANGGKDAPEAQTFPKGGDFWVSSDIPVNEHTVIFHDNYEGGGKYEEIYAETFVIWSMMPDGSGGEFAAGEGSGGFQDDFVLYAQWRSPELGDMPEPVRGGYWFMGWYSTPDDENESPLGSLDLVTEDMELYAHWKRAYSIQYEGMGADEIPGEQMKLEGEDLYLSTSIPSMMHTVTFDAGNDEVIDIVYNFEFLSWNTKADGSGDVYGPGSVFRQEADTILYAQWSDAVYGEMPEPSREGQRFLGWFSMDDEENRIEETMLVHSDEHLYARWRALEKYSVKYSANGGSGAPADQTKTETFDLTLESGIPVGAYTISYMDADVKVAEQTIYPVFTGWNTAEDGSGDAYQPGGTYTRDEPAVLYAQWQNPMLEPIAGQEKEGYAFIGWFTDAAEGVKVDASTVVGASMTLYARYEPAVVSSGSCGSGVSWVLYANGHLDISGNGAINDFSHSMMPPWGRETVSVTIGPGVTRIGDCLFCNNVNLIQVELNDGLESIGEWAFDGCEALTSINFPGTLRSLEQCCFLGSGLTDLELPEGLTETGFMSFLGCGNLERISFPSTLVRLGSLSFAHCSNLTEVDIPEGVTQIYNTFNGCTALKRVSIPSSVYRIDEEGFYNCVSLRSIELPEGVQYIGNKVFEGCSALTEITVPRSVISIYDNAIPSTAIIKCYQDSYAATWADSKGYQVEYLQ